MKHDYRLALSSVFQSELREKLTSRPPRLFRPHQTIYRIGDEARSLYYLRRGLVKLEAISEDGREIILSVYQAGEMFGEFALCEEHRIATAVTMESSEIIELGREEIWKVLQEDPDAMRIFLSAMCQRLATSYRVISEFSFDNLPERLAKILLRLADEFGRETQHGTELTHYITQEELSQMLSVRREVVSSELSRLRERGYINYMRKGKLIIDRSALTAFIDAAATRRAGGRGDSGPERFPRISDPPGSHLITTR